MLSQKEYIEIGLNGDAPLKVILKGGVEHHADENIGVVSLVYATMNREAAKQKLAELMKHDEKSYYMVYSVPLELDLTTLNHYPSVAITKADLSSQTF